MIDVYPARDDVTGELRGVSKGENSERQYYASRYEDALVLEHVNDDQTRYTDTAPGVLLEFNSLYKATINFSSDLAYLARKVFNDGRVEWHVPPPGIPYKDLIAMMFPGLFTNPLTILKNSPTQWGFFRSMVSPLDFWVEPVVGPIFQVDPSRITVSLNIHYFNPVQYYGDISVGISYVDDVFRQLGSVLTNAFTSATIQKNHTGAPGNNSPVGVYIPEDVQGGIAFIDGVEVF